MIEESDGIGPEPDLMIGEEGEYGGDDVEGGGGSSFREQKGEREQDAEHRDVGEAIGHGLQTDLYDSRGGDQRSDEPEPSDGKVGTPLPLPEAKGGDDEQKSSGCGNEPHGEHGFVGIEDGEWLRWKTFCRGSVRS